jgi:hypothetical protein
VDATLQVLPHVVLNVTPEVEDIWYLIAVFFICVPFIALSSLFMIVFWEKNMKLVSVAARFKCIRVGILIQGDHGNSICHRTSWVTAEMLSCLSVPWNYCPSKNPACCLF